MAAWLGLIMRWRVRALLAVDVPAAGLHGVGDGEDFEVVGRARKTRWQAYRYPSPGSGGMPSRKRRVVRIPGQRGDGKRPSQRHHRRPGRRDRAAWSGAAIVVEAMMPPASRDRRRTDSAAGRRRGSFAPSRRPWPAKPYFVQVGEIDVTPGTLKSNGGMG